MSNLIRVAERTDCSSCKDFELTYDLVRKRSLEIANAIAEKRSTLNDLASTIESAIIPRLLLSHGMGQPVNDLSHRDFTAISPETVQSFTDLVFSPDNSEAAERVERLLSDGVTADRIMLDLLAPSARLMGDMWTADQLSFVDVTLGLSRIQQLLRQIKGINDTRQAPAFEKGRALLVPAPGEQHTFGLRLVEEFLLRDGWEVRSNLRAELADIQQLVSDEAYDFVGFSLSGERLLPALQSAIREVRKSSLKRGVRVMVGGVLFAERPELVRECGADAAVLDAEQAVAVANEWYTPAHVN